MQSVCSGKRCWCLQKYAYRRFGRNHSSRNPDFPYRWSGSSIADSLENIDYIGIQVSCKTHKPSYKSDLVVEVPEGKVENAHEPIIDRERRRYLVEQEALKGHISHLGTELAGQQDELDDVGNFLVIVGRHLEVPELTPEILREFVHHITVHERDGAYRKKFYSQKIDIHFIYIGTIQ